MGNTGEIKKIEERSFTCRRCGLPIMSSLMFSQRGGMKSLAAIKRLDGTKYNA